MLKSRANTLFSAVNNEQLEKIIVADASHEQNLANYSKLSLHPGVRG
jgi:hypothetical protein